ncbi:MAG: hypothetical protein MUF18_03370 [Fimbriiglobus sp.]|nr:hypothetical protein [Fimbriiglobus sp.]
MRFSLTVAVPDADIDRHGHLNNVAYVRLVQEAAAAHWQAVSTPELRAEVAWFVRRHGTVMASARTVWVLVDAATGRPKRIDLRLKEMFGG